MKFFLFSLIGGILVGLSLGFFELFSGRNSILEFHSIPNLNRSVIYHIITIFTMIAILLDSSKKFSTKLRIWVSVCLLAFMIALIVMGSRAGIITFFTGVMLSFILLLGHQRIMLILGSGLIVFVLLMIGISTSMKIPVLQHRVDKFKYYYEVVKNKSTSMSHITISNRVRYDYLRVAWAQVTQKGNMLIGSGPATFGYINVEELKFNPPLLEYKKSWDRPSHAHNAYLNLWVEQGLIGTALYILFFVYLTIYLLKNRLKLGQIHWQWVACLGVLNTAIIAGLFNTVLANESAWQAMMLTGIFIQWTKLPGTSNP
jgi:O-antigen ligase